MSASRSASANFADASVNMLPHPLPDLPPGWIYGERTGGFGPHAIVEDPDFVGERPPRPATR